MSTPRQERWRVRRWASRICRCPSGRRVRSGIRCGRAAGLACSLLGKIQQQEYQPEGNNQTYNMAQKRRDATDWRISTHGSDKTAVCGSRKDLLLQSYIPAVGKQQEALDLWCQLSQKCTRIEEPDLVQQRPRMFLKRPSKIKYSWISHLPQKQVADFQSLSSCLVVVVWLRCDPPWGKHTIKAINEHVCMHQACH